MKEVHNTDPNLMASLTQSSSKNYNDDSSPSSLIVGTKASNSNQEIVLPQVKNSQTIFTNSDFQKFQQGSQSFQVVNVNNETSPGGQNMVQIITAVDNNQRETEIITDEEGRIITTETGPIEVKDYMKKLQFPQIICCI